MSLPERRKVLISFGVAVAVLFVAVIYYGLTHSVSFLRTRQRGLVAHALPAHATLSTSRGYTHRFEGESQGSQEESGLALPPLVLVHGFGADAGSWARVVPGLLKERSVVIVELPGHGEAAPLKPPLRVDDLVEGLSVALEDVRAPFVLVGNSLGGALSVGYAAEHPERVAQLILVNSAGGSWAALRRETLLPNNRKEMRVKMRILMADKAPDTPDFILDQILEMNREPRMVSLWEDLQDGPYFDEELTHLKAPVELVWGTPDEYFPVEGYVSRLRDELPGASFSTLDGCGHVPQLTCPDEFVRMVLSLARP